MNTIGAPAGWRDDDPNAWGRPQLPPNCAWNPETARWEAPQPRHVDSSRWANDSCTPSRHRSLTAQPQQQAKPIVYAQYDPAFDPDLHPQPVPVTRPTPAPVVPDLAPIAVPSWPTRQPVEQPAVVEPEPVPLVVNRTAARFASLEVRR